MVHQSSPDFTCTPMKGRNLSSITCLLAFLVCSNESYLKMAENCDLCVRWLMEAGLRFPASRASRRLSWQKAMSGVFFFMFDILNIKMASLSVTYPPTGPGLGEYEYKGYYSYDT